MPGLTTSLTIATQALLAQQGALAATTNNIANMNTEGYSRQRAVLSQATPTQEGNLVFGNGVTLERFESIRDELLELRIQQQTQEQSNSEARLGALQQVETLFSDSTNGIGAKLSALFNSFQALSTDASSSTARKGILTAANNLTTAFHEISAKLAAMQSNLDLEVTQGVNQVNTLTQQIAELNVQVAQVKTAAQDPGALEDQRNNLIRQLSELIDITSVQTGDGAIVTTANGTALVVGNTSFALQAANDSTGMQHVYAQGKDITSYISQGKLAGVLDVRDDVIPTIQSQLNTLASDLATAFNSAQGMGYDLSGVQGTDFFTVPADAATFKVAITDPDKIAASSDKSAGSLGNLANLIGVRNQKLSLGRTAEEVYSSLVFTVGNASAQAKAESAAGDLSLRQLSNQRNALSGVNESEETALLIRYQHAFQAAARVISTVDELLDTVMAIGGR